MVHRSARCWYLGALPSACPSDVRFPKGETRLVDATSDFRRPFFKNRSPPSPFVACFECPVESSLAKCLGKLNVRYAPGNEGYLLTIPVSYYVLASFRSLFAKSSFWHNTSVREISIRHVFVSVSGRSPAFLAVVTRLSQTCLSVFLVATNFETTEFWNSRLHGFLVESNILLARE